MPRNGSGSYSLPVNSWNPAVNAVSATAADWQSLINDLATAMQASLSADGQTLVTGSIAMGSNKLTGLAAGTATGNSLRFEQLFSQGVEADVASAATVDIGAVNTNFVQVTGTTTITSFGTNYNGPRFVRFSGILTLTHNATTLILPTAANITTAAGDTCIVGVKATAGTANGWEVLAYQRASGAPLVTGTPADGSITTAKIVDDNITYAKIQNVSATSRVLGRRTAAAGDTEECTLTQVLDFVGSPAQGDILYRNASDWVRLGAGTSGYFLKTQGAAANPLWADNTNTVKAWVNFNGTGVVAIRASLNVSSITDNGVGDYTVNFTSAFSDANYAAALSIENTVLTVTVSSGTPRTTTALRLLVINGAFAAADCAVVNAICTR